MKKHIPGFIAGVLVTTTLLGTAAASGALTLSVTPVNIKVNGEVFQPKDVNGDDVMVFAYNGTTYAPLRALAEAYGLQVGWDQASGTATVVDPDAEQVAPDTTANAYADWTAEEEAAYQEFKGMWDFEQTHSGTSDEGKTFAIWVGHYKLPKDNATATSDMEQYSDSYEWRKRILLELREDEEITNLYFTNTPPDGSAGMHILPGTYSEDIFNR